MFLNNQQVAEEIKREIKKFLETNDNENRPTQDLWDAAKAVLREVYSNTILPPETRKTSDRQPNFTPKTTRKKRTKKPPKISRRKETIKISTEINEKETIVKINKPKSWFFEKINKIDKPLVRLIKKKREESNQQN